MMSVFELLLFFSKNIQKINSKNQGNRMLWKFYKHYEIEKIGNIINIHYFVFIDIVKYFQSSHIFGGLQLEIDF